jgi:hypothetical protein
VSVEELLHLARSGHICVRGPPPRPPKQVSRRGRGDDGLPDPPPGLDRNRLEELVMEHLGRGLHSFTFQLTLSRF